MKKNDGILAVAVAVYSFLFYEQGLGVNFLLFTICLITLLCYRDKTVYKARNWQLAAVGSVLSAFCIMFYGDGVSLIANIFSLCLLSAYSFHSRTSVITSLFFTFYSIILSGVFMIIDTIKRFQNNLMKGNSMKSIKLVLYVIPFLIATMFFFMYKSASPLFNNFTQNINLDFISFSWVFFTMSGLFFMYGFFYHKTILFIRQIDESPSNSLSASSVGPNILPIDSEKLSGVILLLMLNILLITVNILDINYLWFDGTLPKDLSYSEFVHQGTEMLIASIVVAILVIMFYFRGALNFHKKNKMLKLLAYLWIIQNVFMVISTAYRNNIYINEYGLTYLRIGVYVWLTLALIGLVTTMIKILKVKSNWYLFRTNAWLFYGVLIMSCFINWDVMLTEFNINRSVKNNRALDKMYLLSLSDKNLPHLFLISDPFKDGTGNSNNEDSGYKAGLDKKLSLFLQRINLKDWQSWNYYDNHVYQQILKLYLEGKIKQLPSTNISDTQ